MSWWFARHKKRPALRKLAEWVTLGLSLVVVLGLGWYLSVRAMREPAKVMLPKFMLRLDQTEVIEGLYVVPLEMRNESERTLAELRVEVVETQAGGLVARREIDAEYLGQGGQQVVYLYFDRDPRAMVIKVNPLHYKLE